MKAISGLTRTPLFSPMVTDYYSGMIVSVPLFTDMLQKKLSPEEMRDFFAGYYQEEKFLCTAPFGSEADSSGFLSGNTASGWDGMEIFVTGNEELDKKFVAEAKAAGFENLKGHRTVGGMRASIYNAMPIEGVEKLVEFMKEFEKNNG